MVSSTFGGVIGHDRVIALLERDVSRPGQAYLLRRFFEDCIHDGRAAFCCGSAVPDWGPARCPLLELSASRLR